jgi:hypothetical protein
MLTIVCYEHSPNANADQNPNRLHPEK